MCLLNILVSSNLVLQSAGLYRDLTFQSLKLQYLLRLVTLLFSFALLVFQLCMFLIFGSIYIIIFIVLVNNLLNFFAGDYNTWKFIIFSGQSVRGQFACAVHLWRRGLNVVIWFEG